ncbi:MAG: glycosyltransferase family 39 protein [Nitrospirae bacterium]|nr:glycosyltransferase family 39 protein [Nitrospirota bacterium]
MPSDNARASTAASTFARWKTPLLLCLVLLFVIAVRARLLDVPLERDEGEYAYMGQLILQGVPPYVEAYNMKFPGTYLMYALVMSVFGQTAQGIHLGFMFANCVSIALIFFLARKLLSETAALAASASYAVLSLSPSVLGFAAHATHFVVPFALGGIIVLLGAVEGNRPRLYLLSGVLCGLATLMKQPGALFAVFCVAHLIYRYFSGWETARNISMRIGLFVAGVIAPLAAVMVWLQLNGAFGRFWFWTIDYATKYASQVPASEVFNVFSRNLAAVTSGFLLLWLIAAAGFIVTLFNRKLKADRPFLLLLALFSFLTIAPGFYFRQHYFVTFLPAVAILAGVFVDYACWFTSRGLKPSVESSSSVVTSVAARYSGLLVLIVAIAAGVFAEREYLFSEPPAAISRRAYGLNPFPESVEIAKFIEANSAKDDKIAILGSEPQILFYSHRRSATGYIYVYSLMEKHEYSLAMQKEMIGQIESARPKYIVFVPIDASWLAWKDAEMHILRWLQGELQRNYTVVGVADIVAPEPTVYKWNDEARNYSVRSKWNVLIYKRNGSG